MDTREFDARFGRVLAQPSTEEMKAAAGIEENRRRHAGRYLHAFNRGIITVGELVDELMDVSICPLCATEKGKGDDHRKHPLVESFVIEDGEPDRCERDHVDGSVCLRILRADGSCPDEEFHR